MILLDNSSSSSIDPSTHRQLGLFDIEISEQDRSEQEHIINQALISAVHAFSARWMPLSCFGQATAANLPKLVTIKEQFIDSIWKRARKDVTQVCTRPSYRSILALYLFGVTPTSSKNKDRPIADYCMETSLRHFVQLRARKRVNETQTPLNSTSNIEPVLEVSMEAAQDEHRHLEDTAYWFGVVIDGSRALTRCQPSVLLPGLADQSQVWTLIEQQSDRFGTVFQRIQATKALLTDETVTSMVQCGFSCKTLFWKAVSRLQECLFHQTLDLPFESVLENIQKEIHRFESIFTPFLDQCARDYVLLSEKSRISFCKALYLNEGLELTTKIVILSFHFHLGVLIMVDTLDWQKSIAENSSTIDIARSRLSSVRAIVNLINLMLSQADPFSGDDTTSIILKDPYPEHTRNGLSRAAYSVLILYDAGTLPKQMAEVMSSSLFAGLEVLRQISFTAAESLTDLYQAYSKSDLIIRRRQPEASTFLTAVPSAFGPALTPDLFEEETFKQLDLASGDPLLVNKTIGRHEIHEVADDFAWFDLDGADFDFMTQDWSFEVPLPCTVLLSRS